MIAVAQPATSRPAAGTSRPARGTERVTAEFLLDGLTALGKTMPDVQLVADQLAGVLYPVPVRAPRPGRAVLGCRCGRAVDAADLRWAQTSTARVRCAACVAVDQPARRCA